MLYTDQSNDSGTTSVCGPDPAEEEGTAISKQEGLSRFIEGNSEGAEPCLASGGPVFHPQISPTDVKARRERYAHLGWPPA